MRIMNVNVATCGPGCTVYSTHTHTHTRLQAPKVAGMMVLAIAAVVCVALTSNQMGKVELEEMQQLRTGFNVANAILEQSGVHDKQVNISTLRQTAKTHTVALLSHTVLLCPFFVLAHSIPCLQPVTPASPTRSFYA